MHLAMGPWDPGACALVALGRNDHHRPAPLSENKYHISHMAQNFPHSGHLSSQVKNYSPNTQNRSAS